MNVAAYTIVALIILIAVGGIIAWLGDVIGYRLGKRRSSIFGLRPRTTARLVGITVGAILPLIGLGVAALGSSYVRDALFRIQYLRDQQVQLGQRVDELGETKREAEEGANEARQKAAEAQQQAAEFETQIVELHTEAGRLSGQITGLQEQLNDLRQQYAQAQSDLARSKDQLAKVSEDNDELQQTGIKLTSDIQSLQLDIQSLQGELDLRSDRLDQAKRTLEKAEEELAGREMRIAEKQVELDELQTQLQEVEARLKAKLRAWKQASYGPVLYETGHELVRDVIAANQTLEQIKSSLTEDVVLASKVARASGVVTEEGRSVRVYLPKLAEEQLGEASEEEIISRVARGIHSGEQDSYIVSIQTVARVFAAQPEPEPVPVVLLTVPNSRVFSKGETIVQIQIDGAAPRDKIFGQIWFVLSLLRQEAQQHGVLPHPETGQYGDAPAEQLLAALDQLQSAGQPQTVRAVAAEDVYCDGMEPFLVTIEVGGESEF